MLQRRKGGPVVLDMNRSTGRVPNSRRLDGCSADAQQSVLPSASPHKVEAVRWTNCGGASVVFYRVVGAGHDAASALNVGQLLLDFFRDKTR